MSEEKPVQLGWSELRHSGLVYRDMIQRAADSYLRAIKEEADTRHQDNAGQAMARSFHSVRNAVQQLEEFLNEHRKSYNVNDKGDWVIKMCEESADFWAKIYAACEWGTFQLCKSVSETMDLDEPEAK